MHLLIQLSIAIICLFIIWRIYKVIQANPEMLSQQNISKSFTTMGILALILIGGIAMLILLVRN